MHHHCETFDKRFRYETKDKLFKRNCHKIFEQLTFMRYIVKNPNVNNLSETIKKYVNIRNTNYCFFKLFVCLN